MDLVECHAPGEVVVWETQGSKKIRPGIPTGASAEADSMEAVCCAYVLREAKQCETYLCCVCF